MEKKTISGKQIDWARNVLKLGEKATMDEIKKAYRESCKKWHPDQIDLTTKDEANQKMQEINEAYQTILRYCNEYTYSFKPRGDENFDPESWWWDQFGSAFAGNTARGKQKKNK